MHAVKAMAERPGHVCLIVHEDYVPSHMLLCLYRYPTAIHSRHLQLACEQKHVQIDCNARHAAYPDVLLLCMQFCEQLCQALCGAMLRNAVSVYDEAHGAAVRLLACVLGQPSLRASLKAEAGAFIPLLLLRPLEQER